MKFSIRDLLLVTLVVALAVGWWLDRQANISRIKLLESTLSDFRRYGVPVDVDSGSQFDPNGPPLGIFVPSPPAAPGSATFVPMPPQR